MKKPAKSTKAVELASLQGTFTTMIQVIRANTEALEKIDRQLTAMHAHRNLIPAVCHSLDRLQAEFSSLRLKRKRWGK